MEQQAVEAAAIAGSVSGDLSILSLVARADFIVKLVLVLLLGSSIWSWAIIFDKVRRIRRVSAKASELRRSFGRADRSRIFTTGSAPRPITLWRSCLPRRCASGAGPARMVWSKAIA